MHGLGTYRPGAYTIMTIKMAAMTRTRTNISDKFSVIFLHGIRSIHTAIVTFDQLVQWIHLNIFHIVISASLRMPLLLTVVEVLLTVMRAKLCSH